MISTDISQAIRILQGEGIIGLPTETVYGLAGNIFSEKAIRQIYEVKQRPHFNPLIVHLKSAGDLEKVARDISQQAQDLAEAFWPGPLTLVLKKQPHIPDSITAGKDTVAVRVPNHPTALALLEQLDFPLAAPSANPFSTISPTSAQHVAQYFGDRIPMVLDGGACKRGIESTIIGFDEHGPVLYRHGSLALAEIERIIGPIRIKNTNNQSPEAPGMLLKHYSPKTKFILTDQPIEVLENLSDQKIGLITFHTPINHSAVIRCEVLSEQANLEEAASRLYAVMHRLDSLELDVIVAERMPNDGLGLSINDRMQRASF